MYLYVHVSLCVHHFVAAMQLNWFHSVRVFVCMRMNMSACTTIGFVCVHVNVCRGCMRERQLNLLNSIVFAMILFRSFLFHLRPQNTLKSMQIFNYGINDNFSFFLSFILPICA